MDIKEKQILIEKANLKVNLSYFVMVVSCALMLMQVAVSIIFNLSGINVYSIGIPSAIFFGILFLASAFITMIFKKKREDIYKNII